LSNTLISARSTAMSNPPSSRTSDQKQFSVSAAKRIEKLRAVET
jgi:hypothetical protein